MKINILTQYFPPEVGAPQNRLFELALKLKEKGAEINVITAMPNYPQMKIYDGYKGKCYKKENIDGINVHRAWIFVSEKKTIIRRLLNYFSFVFSSFFIGLFKFKKADYLICESPPLFLGITAVLLSRIKKNKLIFNVSDLWPESAEKLEIISNKFLLKISTKLEHWLYKKSYLITGQTQGIVDNIKNRFPNKDVYWLPNGVDLSFYKSENYHQNWRKDNNFNDDDFLLIYAGIHGYAQGLEVIIGAAEILQSYLHIKFVLVGSGPEKEKLQNLVKNKELQNVFFFETVAKSEMPIILNSINASIVPLKKIELFKGAIPSKIFETLAMKRPIILGVEGEAYDFFIKDGKCGLFFEPENCISLSEQIYKLTQDVELYAKLQKNSRLYVENNFSRISIATKLWEKLSNK